jgi:hypothetical protein
MFRDDLVFRKVEKYLIEYIEQNEIKSIQNLIGKAGK